MLLCRVQNAFAVSEGRGERVRNVGGDCRAAKLERRSGDSQASAEGKEMSLLSRPAAPGHCGFAQAKPDWDTRQKSLPDFPLELTGFSPQQL